jgi:hypothetical protein
MVMSSHRVLPSGREVEYDPRHRQYSVECLGEQFDSVPYAIVELIATLEDAEPTQLEPLGEHVNTDALERLFDPAHRHGHGAGVVRFEYDGYTVGVHATRITASPQE